MACFSLQSTGTLPALHCVQGRAGRQENPLARLIAKLEATYCVRAAATACGQLSLPPASSLSSFVHLSMLAPAAFLTAAGGRTV